jgi:hypothetical protein
VPALIAPLLGFALGALLAWVQRDAHLSEAVARRDAWVVGLYATLVFAPASGYFLLFAADWSYAYLVDPQRVPSAVQLTLIVGNAASVLGGFSLARRAAESRAPRAMVATLAVPVGLALTAVVALGARLGVDASYAQFQGGFGARPLAGGRLGAAILYMDALVAVGAALAARAIQHRAPPAASPMRRTPARWLGQASSFERERP